ncbi:MAG TPA: PHP domain-containing protein [Polyangium sp.]|nr:PHP domain-containing protein [Polyangium sp.]
MDVDITADLHGHTRYSDGRATPEEYVEYRRSIGMRLCAVADHDVLTAVPSAALAAQKAGMWFLPAVEVTSFLHFGTPEAEQFHVLAYYPPAFVQPTRLMRTSLYARGQQVQKRWKTFVLDWLFSLGENDRQALDPDNVLPSLNDQEFPALQSMIDLISLRKAECFDVFRRHHVDFWEKDRELFGWTPEEAMEAIRADGAFDVVAHPGRYRDKPRTEKALRFASGIEVYTSRHRGDVAKRFLEFAEEHRKAWTVSADDHQNARYIRPPCGIPVHTVEKLFGRTLSMNEIMGR